MKFKTRYFLLGMIVLFTIFSVFGCGAQKNVSVKSEPKMAAEDSSVGFTNQERADKKTENKTHSNLSQRKIIKSARIQLETQHFDQVTGTIIDKTNALGGYIESSDITGKRINHQGNIQNRRAYLKLRIPEDVFEDFILEFDELGNVINSQTNGEDITGQYFDTEARLKSLRIHEERLLEILRKAAKIEDVIELERELSDIRYKIENLTGTIRKWDNMISYATLDVEIYEVQEIIATKQNPVTLSQKMSSGFNNSVKILVEISKGLLVVLVSLIPFAIIVIPLALVAFYLYRNKNKFNKNMDQ